MDVVVVIAVLMATGPLLLGFGRLLMLIPAAILYGIDEACHFVFAMCMRLNYVRNWEAPVQEAHTYVEVEQDYHETYWTR